jgi:hypothetical protein
VTSQVFKYLLAPVQHSLAIIWVGSRDYFHLLKLDVIHLFVFVEFGSRLNTNVRFTLEYQIHHCKRVTHLRDTISSLAASKIHN